ncbi:MAG TPA: asparagine--tRNA ligase [Clostridia bacterium]|nr:asparagine--tRNA ligase [Clostridia bacterium]HPY43745.1 asparagine--tRNA ligase [Clostridia bacterium]HQA97156.1 asparagine--tRNA ligase [Clostridia bacterium]HQO55597.1 asparagine--tRNA ligase [Clostridia bacterium]HUM60915.1 asparagine--tRNA ligase [Clostridia bacterium]
MKPTEIASLYKHTPEDGSAVRVNGWVRTLRGSKAHAFVELNDGSSFRNLQVVVDESLPNFEEIIKATLYTSLEVTGRLVHTPQMKQPFELTADSVTVLGLSAPDYPLQKKRHSFEYLRTLSHLRPRTNTFSAVFRIRSLAALAIHSYFASKGFFYVHTPIITTSDAEGAGEMFRVTTLDLDDLPKTKEGSVDFSKDFFGKSAQLTVSGQLQAEAYALALGKVYTFGPTFRSENSNTARHAAEFWMIEPEIAFADLNDNMDLAEDMVRSVIATVMEQAEDELRFLNQFVDKELLARLELVKNSEFSRVTYTEAIEILKASGRQFEYPVSWGMDLQTEHERYLAEEHFKRPVFVSDYPKDIKAFYMRANEDGKTVAAMDLMVPGVGEMIGGSQREERYEQLLKRVREMGLAEEEYAWYLDLRRFGTAKHAGFGLGFERFVMYLTGITNIRDVLPFPRTVGHAEF